MEDKKQAHMWGAFPDSRVDWNSSDSKARYVSGTILFLIGLRICFPFRGKKVFYGKSALAWVAPQFILHFTGLLLLLNDFYTNISVLYSAFFTQEFSLGRYGGSILNSLTLGICRFFEYPVVITFTHIYALFAFTHVRSKLWKYCVRAKKSCWLYTNAEPKRGFY